MATCRGLVLLLPCRHFAAPPCIRWTSTASRHAAGKGEGAGRPAGSKAAVIVASFADLKPWLKQMMRRVHPDTVHTQSEEVRAQNHDSLLAMGGMFDALRERCEACAAPKTEPPVIPALQASYKLKFYWVEEGSLKEATYDAAMPLDLDAQTRLLISRCVASPSLHAQWLSVATVHARQLLEGVGIPCGIAVKKPKVKAAPRLFEQAPQAPNAIALLRENLITWSPLQQGKITAFPKPKPITVVGSVWTESRREKRVSDLFERGRVAADPGVPVNEGRFAKAALAAFLIRHFDRSLAFHDVWFSISIVLCRVYQFVPQTRTLYIPAAFKEAELAEFLDTHLPHIARDAIADARVKAKGIKHAKRQRAVRWQP